MRKLVCVSPGIITLLAFCSDLVDNQKWFSNIEIHIYLVDWSVTYMYLLMMKQDPKMML